MNLADPGTLKSFLARHGIDARKGLGQHFLCSSHVVKAIVHRLRGMAGVLEIGPGPGVLTGAIAETAVNVIAIELDPRMIEALNESAPRVEVRQIDALKVDMAAILQELPEPRAVVSNLPYYITGPLITAIAGAAAHFDRAVLMMQREVADRVLALPGNRNRGSLSVFLQSRFAISKVVNVPAGAFVPAPKVESAVLDFVPTGEILAESFHRFVRLGFAQPRKTLANNLASGLGCERSIVVLGMGGVGLDAAARPSEPTLEQWRALWTVLEPHG